MPRGRPKQYDEEAALTGAMLLFWQKGLSATSLDDLSAAMNMNRPSIYNAFGNKEAIYRKALDTFCAQLDEAIDNTLGKSTQLEEGLVSFFHQAIDVYTGSEPSLGCLMICTAPGEAISYPQVGDDLKGLIKRLDSRFTEHLEDAQKQGQLASSVVPQQAAKLLQATLHTVALRARSGESRAQLRKLARYAVTTLTA